MKSVRPSNPRLASFEAYDPVSLDMEVFLSANENPLDVPGPLKTRMLEALETLPFNRYPDPLAGELRGLIAAEVGLEPQNVLIGNGGDELLFNLFLTWGGRDRYFLNFPPTFAVYELDAALTDTNVVNLGRRDDFSIDEEAAIERISRGDIDFAIITSPNNPTGNIVTPTFIERLLDAGDALIMVDEAYVEFADGSLASLVKDHENLIVLRTFSKAYALAGIRVGYIVGSKAVINEFAKVRQPYSVDAAAQVIASTVVRNRDVFAAQIETMKAERDRLEAALSSLDGVTVYPSGANFLLFRVTGAHDLWERLQKEYSVLVRDVSATPGLSDCLRVCVGTPAQDDRFIEALSALI